MKKYIIVNIVGITLVTGAFFAVQRGWAQPSETVGPMRTYVLTIASNELWRIVVQTIDESQFTIQSEDPYRFKVVALGNQYLVPVGFRKKKERQRITIEIGQKRPGIYDCFVKTEILEYWPVYKKWTPKSGSVDTTETLILIGTNLSKKLRPYFKPMGE